MPKLSKNFYGALGIAVATTVYLLEALKLPFGKANNPGEGFVPVLMAGLLLFLCIVLIIKELLVKKHNESEEKDLWDEDEGGESTGIKKTVLIIVALIIYPLVLVKLGFIISTIPLLFVALRLMEYKNWLMSLLVSVIATLFAYFVFSSWLSVYFPKGILG